MRLLSALVPAQTRAFPEAALTTRQPPCGAPLRRFLTPAGVGSRATPPLTALPAYDKPLGGWDKLKEEAEITALLEGGTFMDVLRANPSGGDNGHILDARRSATGGEIETSVTQDGDTWTAVIKRPLDTGAPGDITIEPGKTYTVGFAIHDDHTIGRFHHVSMDWHMALDNPEATINVVAR